MSDTVFAIPMRPAVPNKSVTLDPVFTLMYEDKKKVLKEFLIKKKPLNLSRSLREPEFMEYVLSKEPGPAVEYKNLRPALTAIRPFLDSSPEGQGLLAFYKKLLQLQTHWAITATETHLYEIFTKLCKALFIDRTDEKLLAHIDKVFPRGRKLIDDVKNINVTAFEKQLLDELNRLRQQQAVNAEKLFDFKVSETFFSQHGKLIAAIEGHEKKLEELRMRAARRKAARDARNRAIREANLEPSLFCQQMGNVGMYDERLGSTNFFEYAREWQNKFGSTDHANDPVEEWDISAEYNWHGYPDLLRCCC